MTSGYEYLAYGPQDGAPEKLVILLHGYGRNAFTMEKMALAARDAVPQALILSPHAPQALDTSAIEDPDTDHFLHMPQELREDKGGGEALSRQWFPIDGHLELLIPRLQKAADDLNLFIDAQRDMLGLTDRDIAVMGFSQGAGLALYTALSRRAEIAGLVCHSAIAIQQSAAHSSLMSKPEVLYIYGEQDGEFTQDRYHATFNWLQAYTGNRATEITVAGLGHFTNAESRRHCAEFIRKVLGGP